MVDTAEGGTVKYQEEEFFPAADAFANWTVDGQDYPGFASGPCPSCGDLMHADFDWGTVQGKGTSGAAAPVPADERRSFTMSCACKVNHPDDTSPNKAPQQGCGRSWRVSVSLRKASAGPRIRPLADEELRPALDAWNAFVEAEESTVQTMAEKWTSAITVLLGLFGLAAAATGKDAFTGLPGCAKWIAGISFLAAVVCGIRAVVISNRAAYGRPAEITITNDQELAKWFAGQSVAARRKNLKDVVESMQFALRLAVGAVLLLVLAAALIALVPRHTEPLKPYACQIVGAATPTADAGYGVTATATCGPPTSTAGSTPPHLPAGPSRPTPPPELPCLTGPPPCTSGPTPIPPDRLPNTPS